MIAAPIELKRNGSWLILLSLLTNAKNVQNYPTFCNQGLEEKNYQLVPDRASNKNHQESIFYEFAYTLRVFDESCVITNSHTLRIEFDRITKVSDILIGGTTFDIDAIKASLWRGTTSFECKFSGNFTKLSTGRFASFSCLSNGAYNSAGLAGDAIEIATYQPAISVDLKNLKKEGSFGWLYLMQKMKGNAHNQLEKCLPPGLYPGQRLNPEKQFYSRGENVTFVCPEGMVVVDAQRTCLRNGIWSHSTPKCHAKIDTSQVNDEKKQCSPITTYIGMPENYKNYELISEGSINELLMTSPCREGFQFVGKLSEINQCRDGTWLGSGFPICEAFRVKSPPEVEHASWVYVHGNGHHEIIYICENGYHVTGEGRATYSIENDAWIDVPECQKATLLYTMRENWPIFLIAGLVAFIGVATYPIYRAVRLRRPAEEAGDDDGNDNEEPSNQES